MYQTYSNKGRENNNILNPGGAPLNGMNSNEGYRPARGGYTDYGQHKQSDAASLIYQGDSIKGTPQRSVNQNPNYKSSIQFSSDVPQVNMNAA